MSSVATLTELTLAQRRELLKMARSRDLVGERSELPPIERVPRDGRLPLSLAQQGLWFVEQLGGLGATYHMPARLRMRGELDRDALVRALDAIVARHESLRTVFTQVDGIPEQRIAPAEASRFHLVEHDLRGRADADAELDRWMAEEARAPFDLERGPLIRGRLIRLAPADHVLLLTTHHIVSDGWSMGVLNRELGALYGAFRGGEPDPLPAPAVQYADYAAWQRRLVEGGLLREQADYWAQALAGAPELLALPTDRPRPARMDHAGARVEVVLDEDLTAGLKALSRRRGTTLFMTLLAGWATVLGRLSGQDDVVIGTPTANRGRREIEGLVGLFLGTLPLRVDLSGAPTVAELLARVKKRALEGQRNQDIPFEQVVERVDPVRSMAYTPLFQAMFTWQNAQRERLDLAGLQVTPEAVAAAGGAKFDLALAVGEREGRITGGVTYATALFDRETVERWTGYLRRVLEEMVADDGRPVERLALMAESERRLVVEEWNRTDAPYPAGSCIHELFEAQAARTPDATAVVCEGETVTYAALNARANRLAHHLRAMGVGPGVRVGLCVERSPAMVEGILGVLKAGGAFVPLDPGYPAERLAYMLADSAPALVLAQRHVRDRIHTDVPVVELDVASPTWAGRPATDPERGALTPAHPAYVTYTSGSTGQPKGVPAVHHKVLNLIDWYGRELAIGERDAVLLVMSFSFDGTYRNLFAPLFAGAQLHLASEPFDPARIVAQIAAHPIRLVNLTPSAFQALRAADNRGALARLRTVVLVGEPVQPRALLEMPEPRPEFVNLYGPTECSGITTYHRLSRALERYLEQPVPVGRPIPNSRIYLLDAAGAPVPVGVAGELHVGGTPVGNGYQNRPGHTAERFIPDPFSARPGARMYRTGDLARWKESAEVRECGSAEAGAGCGDSRTDALTHSRTGVLEFLGRMDNQVKVRGYRIELGEIEARLAEHAAVREAVALVREDAPGEKRLVAYWVGDAVDAETLRAHLGQALPPYMVPSAYVRMEAWPLTPNRKLDRRALPAPEGDAWAARGYEAPVGETEQALADIWAEVLRVERVGRGDSFFELGGHSLLAVQVISRVRQVLRVEVALGELFTRPVLGDFARGLETAARADLPPIEPADRRGHVPLSFAQQRLWFLERLGSLGSTYHIPGRLRLRGELDRGALVRALDAIVARHEALRTTFAEVNGVPEQRIAAAADSAFRLVEHDLGGRADAEAELGRVMAEEAGAPFDLRRGPLIRGRLVRMAGDDHVLLLTMHHIVSDGWSIGVLTHELGALYGAFRQGGPDPLPALPVQYADYAAWQRRWVDGDVLRAQAAYWTETLGGAPELLELPADRPRPAQMDHAGAQLGVVLDAELTAGLKALARRHGTTLFMTLLAGWATVLGRLSGQDDVVIGTPTAGRGRREIEGLIGFFVNTLAVRLDLSGAPTVAELLGRVKKGALAAQHHQDLPFEQVVELVDPVRSLSHGPLFQVMFSWQNAPRGSMELPGLESVGVGGAGTGPAEVQAKFDLSLSMRAVGDRIVGGLTYATALYETETVERWAGYLRRVLEQMVADDRRSVPRLALLTDGERATVVDAWNRTDAAYPAGWCVHETFEAQVARTPHATALVAEGQAPLTYAALNRRANRLAHHLRARGVGPDVRVGVCLERGPEMIVAVLAVLKAGGAYVPLDPEYPADRLEHMLADAAPAVLLTQASLAGCFAGSAVPRVRVDADADDWAGAPETDPERGALTPEHLAYVIYTSGSTGQPKGVMNQHRALVNRLAWGRRSWAMDAGEAVLCKTSLNFDGSVREIFLPLMAGGRVVLARPGGHRDPAYLLEAIGREGITTVNLVPSLLQLLLEAPGAERLRGLKRVLCGGEALPGALLERFRQVLPEVELHNLYGPSEAATAVTWPRCQAEPGRATVPIGGPSANARVYVLDGAGEPVPVGVAGELFIGGVAVARGYHERAALTAERFVPDPFGGEPGARLYRTGDVVRWREVRECVSAEVREWSGDEVSRDDAATDALTHSRTHALDFVGRNDDQVKVRGFRVELGEIEARLREHPGVRETVVLVREDVPGDRRLVAYCVAEEAADAEALRAHLAGRLPEYMVPAAYVRLDALPLTPSGKLERRALPAPEGEAYVSREYEAPVNETEEALAGIWAEVLRVERVGRRDNFFDLGGHSLLAVQVVSRVRQALGVELALGELFTRPVLQDLAQEVVDAQLAQFDPDEIAALAELLGEAAFV